MKKAFLVLAMIALSISPAAAQVKEEEKKAIGTARVAIVNIGVVFHKYEKAQEFKTEIEDAMKPYKQKAKTLTNDAKAWQAEIENPNTDPAQVKVLEASIQFNKKKLEELQLGVQKVITKKQEDNLTILWKDVRYEVKAYAAEKKIDLVLAFGDPADKETLDLFANINRKMQAMDQGGMVPLFAADWVDIAEPVAARLNRKYAEYKKLPRQNVLLPVLAPTAPPPAPSLLPLPPLPDRP